MVAAIAPEVVRAAAGKARPKVASKERREAITGRKSMRVTAAWCLRLGWKIDHQPFDSVTVLCRAGTSDFYQLKVTAGRARAARGAARRAGRPRRLPWGPTSGRGARRWTSGTASLGMAWSAGRTAAPDRDRAPARRRRCRRPSDPR